MRSAINQEIGRGGQIFYVVPRIADIDSISERIKKLVPKFVSFMHKKELAPHYREVNRLKTEKPTSHLNAGVSN